MLILDCASYFKLQVEPQGGGVILLTNDKALSLEAELEGVSTLRIEPNISPQSLLHSFDPILAHQIDLLMTEISFKNLLTAHWYKIPPACNPNQIPIENPKYGPITNSNDSQNIHDPNSTPKKDKLSKSSSFYEQTLDTQKNVDESPAAMPIEIDEEMQISDAELIPISPQLSYRYMLIPTPLPIPKLLYFHHHIEQAVGALLRPRLFHFLLRTFARNDPALLFQEVALVFDKRKTDSPIINVQDPNRWTAIDCLTLIDELWNQSTFEIFEEETNQPLTESTNCSMSQPKSQVKKTLNSRWAPSSQYSTEAQDHLQTSVFSCRLGRTRKAVQVLIDQLQSYHETLHLPRDNPTSWSLLFWDGLIEDIHKITYYGKFYQSLFDLENPEEPKDFLLQKIIQNWKIQARSLC